MVNLKAHWEDASEAERRAVYEAYLKMPDDGIPKASWEQVNACWTGSNFVMLKYTFCPVGYWG